MSHADYSVSLQGYHAVSNGEDSFTVKRKPLPPYIRIKSLTGSAAEDKDDVAAISPRYIAYVPEHHFWKSPNPFNVLIFIADVLLIAFPCFFLALGIEACRLNGTRISQRGKSIEQAASLGPTIFPIIFATIVGRLMRSLALWKAEKGASLGLIELLNGAQNLAATIEKAFLLRNLSVISWMVVFLWALSPLGGQSSLRVLHRTDRPIISNTSLFYFKNTGEDICCGSFSSGSSISKAWVTLNGIVHGALISLRRTNGSDVWGNVKVPFLELLPTYNDSGTVDEWHNFSEDTYNYTYSSLVGNVISGLSSNATTDFVMQSSYFNMSCTGPGFFRVGRSKNGTLSYGGLLEWANIEAKNIYQAVNGTNSYILAWNFTGAPVPNDKHDFRVVYAASQTRNGTVEYAAYRCVMGKVWVDSSISCRGNDCHLKKIRQAGPPKVNGWPWPLRGPSTIPPNLFRFLSDLTSAPTNGMISPADRFIRGSNTPFGFSSGDETDGLPDYHDIDSRQVATRLSSLINTIWQTGYMLQAIVEPPSSNITALTISTNSSNIDPELDGTDKGTGYSTAQTTGQVTTYEGIHTMNQAWVIITIITSTSLICCAITNLWFKYSCTMPDILGYVSSMTRSQLEFENTVNKPRDKTLDQMTGMERARVMKNINMRLVHNDDGTIQLKNADNLNNLTRHKSGNISHLGILK